MKIEHSNITVRSIDETVRFLKVAFPEAEIRGGGAIHGDPALGRWVHFGIEDSYVALQENGQHSGRSDITYQNDGINHLGFVVDGLDELIQKMNKEGYPLTPASALDDHPHRRRAYFFDGNGIEWEFVEYLSENRCERNDYELG